MSKPAAERTITSGKYRGRKVVQMAPEELRDFIDAYRPQSSKGNEILAAARAAWTEANALTTLAPLRDLDGGTCAIVPWTPPRARMKPKVGDMDPVAAATKLWGRLRFLNKWVLALGALLLGFAVVLMWAYPRRTGLIIGKLQFAALAKVGSKFGDGLYAYGEVAAGYFWLTCDRLFDYVDEAVDPTPMAALPPPQRGADSGTSPAGEHPHDAPQRGSGLQRAFVIFGMGYLARFVGAGQQHAGR